MNGIKNLNPITIVFIVFGVLLFIVPLVSIIIALIIRRKQRSKKLAMLKQHEAEEEEESAQRKKGKRHRHRKKKRRTKKKRRRSENETSSHSRVKKAVEEFLRTQTETQISKPPNVEFEPLSSSSKASVKNTQGTSSSTRDINAVVKKMGQWNKEIYDYYGNAEKSFA